jgi:hypothetical protein
MAYTGLRTLPLLAGTIASSSPYQALFARSGYRVYPFQLGSKVRTTSTGTAVELHGQGQLIANDYVIFCDAMDYGSAKMFIPNLNKIRRVTAISSSDDAVTLDSAVSLTAGDYMLVIGADGAATPESAPNYDGSTISLYSDNSGVTAVSPKYLQTTTGGAFIGWVASGTYAVDLLVTNSSGIPQVVQPFVATIPNEEVNQIRTFTAAGATPAVGGFRVIKLGQSGTVSVTNFTGATTGQRILVIATDSNSTLVHNASVMILSGSANKALTTNDVVELVYDGSKWYQATAVTSAGGGTPLTIVTEIELATTTLVATAASIDYQSISQSYEDLIIRILARSDRAGQVTDSLDLKVNNDGTGANYQGEFFTGNNSTSLSARVIGGGTTGLSIAEIPGASSTANYFGYAEITIPFYTGNKIKTMLSRSGNPRDSSNTQVELAMGQWLSTTAISRITLTPSAGPNFIAGTECRLIGRKKTSVLV